MVRPCVHRTIERTRALAEDAKTFLREQMALFKTEDAKGEVSAKIT